MTPGKIPGANLTMKAPDGMANCKDLHIQRHTGYGFPALDSIWTPDAEELERLKAGCPVILTIVGTGMPPVSLNVSAWPVCDYCGHLIEEESAAPGLTRHGACEARRFTSLRPEERAVELAALRAAVKEAREESSALQVEKWRARHDELGRILMGLKPDDTAHNFHHDALCRAAARARAAYVNAACDPAEVAAIDEKQ